MIRRRGKGGGGKEALASTGTNRPSSERTANVSADGVNKTLKDDKISARAEQNIDSSNALTTALLIGLFAAAVACIAIKRSISPPQVLSGSVELPSSADGTVLHSPERSSLPQPLMHMLRANDVPLDQIVHVFNRMEELHRMHLRDNDVPLPKSASKAKAANKVLCSVGLNESSMTLLGRVWVEVLQGAVGHAAPDHSARPTDEVFASCDAIVSAGSAYSTASEWAFHSPVPVINLWNEDKYTPQAALLFAFTLAQQRKRKKNENGKGKTAHEYTTDMLSLVRPPRSLEQMPCSGVDDVDRATGIIAWQEVSRLFNIRLPRSMCASGRTSKGRSGEGNKPKSGFWPTKSIFEAPVTSEPAPLLLAAMVELALAKAGKLPNSFQFPGVRCMPGLVASGKINGHDPHFVFAKEGSIHLALEFERVSKEKYAPSDPSDAFDKAVQAAKSKVNLQEVAFFAVVRSLMVEVGEKEGRKRKRSKGEDDISKFFPDVPVVYREHLRAHAVHGFFDSPFERALVMSIHGGGSEPYDCASYLARRGMDPIVLNLCDSNLQVISNAYARVSRFMPEVVGYEKKKDDLKSWDFLSWPGTFMGYAGLGKHLPCLEAVEEKLLSPKDSDTEWDALNLIKIQCSNSWAKNASVAEFPKHLPLETQRDIASTFEELFERTVIHFVSQLTEHLKDVDGIVLAGGVALNVKLTQRMWNHFNKPVWVPSAPSDPGLGVGGAWSVCHPPRDSIPLQYHGLPLLDKDSLPRIANEWGSNCEKIGMGKEAAVRLASLLAVEKKIVAVVIGNQEYGPRALGHRSLLAYPDSIEIRDRMNALKFRQFYRPTCPTVAEEFVGEMFHKPQNIQSPFMSFAPELQDWVKQDLPAVWHYDGTARPQTLSKSTEPFIHSLLMSIPKVKNEGKPIVINTSFNIKGQPIINTLDDTLFMLCDRPQLDYVFVEGYLFRLEGNATHHQCGNLFKSTAL